MAPSKQSIKQSKGKEVVADVGDEEHTTFRNMVVVFTPVSCFSNALVIYFEHPGYSCFRMLATVTFLGAGVGVYYQLFVDGFRT